MALPSQGAAGGPSEGPPHPSGELWDLCLQLEFFTSKECRLLAAIVQILKEQASSSGNLVRLTSALQEFLGDYEGSLGNVVTKLHQFSADKLGSLLVMIQARIDHADRSSRRASSSYAGPSRAGHVQSSPSASVIEVPITAHPNPTTSPPVIKPLHPPTSQSSKEPLPLGVQPTIKKSRTCNQLKTHDKPCVRCVCKPSCTFRVLVGRGFQGNEFAKTKCSHCPSRAEFFQNCVSQACSRQGLHTCAR